MKVDMQLPAALPHHPFNFRSPPPTLSDPILRKGRSVHVQVRCGGPWGSPSKVAAVTGP